MLIILKGTLPDIAEHVATPNDELAEADSPYHRDYPNTMNRPAQTFPYSTLSISANKQARRFPSIVRTRTGILPNVGTAPNAVSFNTDTSSYFIMPAYHDGYMESNVSSNGYSFHHRKEANTTLTATDSIARPQNHYPTTDSTPHESYNIYIPPIYPVTYDLPSSSAYDGPVHNSPSYHGAQYTPQGGVNVSYPITPVTGSNIPPQMQYPYDYTPHPPQYASPNPEASSSSYLGPSSHHREPPFYLEPSAHYPEMHHGSPVIYDLQEPTASFPGSSTALLPSAAISSQPNIDHGDDISNTSSHPPSIQPHQDLPYRNSRSRQKMRCHRFHPHRIHHSSSTTFSCGWLIGENRTCGFEGPLDAFKTHFRRSHLSGAQDALHACCWQGCNYCKRDNETVHVMRRDSVWRHAKETHLGMKRNS
ncbi:hypothetical protein BDR04DRAFT_1104337 [Suillus decipiens]|nr:hypothetical protein BDR04DRAFT_1104337 [Suillus decipiens]